MEEHSIRGRNIQDLFRKGMEISQRSSSEEGGLTIFLTFLQLLLCIPYLILNSPRKESDWLSLDHMIVHCTTYGKPLINSSTHEKEAILEKEIRVLYQEKKWTLGGEK